MRENLAVIFDSFGLIYKGHLHRGGRVEYNVDKSGWGGGREGLTVCGRLHS